MSKYRLSTHDNKILARTYEKVAQLSWQIEEKTEKDQLAPSDLPPSVLPTAILYDICTYYEAMYDKLLAYELAVAGYPKQELKLH